MTLYKVIDNYSATIVGNFSTTATTITLSAVPSVITAGYLTIYDFSGNQLERIKFTGVAGSTITGCLRGLSFTTNSDTEIPANQKQLQSGMKVKLSVSQQYYNEIVDLFEGVKTLDPTKKMAYTTHPTFTADTELVDKKYVDDIAIAGSPDATTSTKGIGKISSAPASPTSPVFLNAEEVSAAGGTGAGEDKVVRANASGYLDKDFIELGTDPGLEFVSNGLEVKAGTGLTKTAGGLNVDVGTTDGKIVQMTTGDKLPAVDGSNLTGMAFNRLVGTGGSYSAYSNKMLTINDSDYTAVNNTVTKFSDRIQWTPSADTTNSYIKTSELYDGLSQLTFSKTFIFDCSFKWASNSVSRQSGFGFGGAATAFETYTSTNSSIGIVSDGAGAGRKIYAHTANGSSYTNTEITITDVGIVHYLRIEYISATSAKFYIDGSLVATITTTLPTGNAYLTYGAAGSTNSGVSMGLPMISVAK